MKRKFTETIVISAVNLVEGGGLSILKRCVQELSDFNYDGHLKIYALVNSTELLPAYSNVNYIAYPKAKKNWLFRAFYEYVYFYFLSVKIKPTVWISLHDMTPNVCSKYLYVYMHNSAPFFQKRTGLRLDWKFKFFVHFYKYLYKLNVKRNTNVIVQQDWFRTKISKLCNIPKEKIIVAYPEYKEGGVLDYNGNYTKSQFFFNSFPRNFKNFEVICKACGILANQKNITQDWNVYLTIDGSENNYSKEIVEHYKENPHIHFIGLISRERCEEYYRSSECFIFPSLLETWGLPISEFKSYRKKMILADLPYAHESASGAEFVAFFNPNDEVELAAIMESVITGNDTNFFSHCENLKIDEPYCSNWRDFLLRIMPKTKK